VSSILCPPNHPTFLLVFSFSARDSITISDDDFDVPKETPRKGSKVATDNRPKTSPKSSAKDSPIRRTVSSDGIGSLKAKGSATPGESSKKTETIKQEPESAKNGSLLQKQNSWPSLIRKQSAQKIKELFENMEDRQQEEDEEEGKGDEKAPVHLKGREKPAAKPAEDERKKAASSANGSGSIREGTSKGGAEKTKPQPAEKVVEEFSSSEEESEEDALLQPGKEDEESESDLLLHSDDELLVKPNEKFSDVESSDAKGETNEFYVKRHNQEAEKPSAPPSKKTAPVVPRKAAYSLIVINYNFIHRTKREQH